MGILDNLEAYIELEDKAITDWCDDCVVVDSKSQLAAPLADTNDCVVVAIQEQGKFIVLCDECSWVMHEAPS